MRKTHKRVSHVKYGSYFLLIHFTNEICRGVRHICGVYSSVEEEDALCEKMSMNRYVLKFMPIHNLILYDI